MKSSYLNFLFLSLCSFGITAHAAVVSVNVNTYFPNYSQTMSLGLPNGGASNETANIPATGFRMTLPGNVETLGFCIELGQSLSTGNTYSYENGNSLSRAGRGSGTAVRGTVGTGRGANIQSGATGGIGDLHSARIRYLFDNFFVSSTASSWTDPTINIPAFQLAIWELSNDVDFSLANNASLTTDFYATSTAGTAATYNRAVSLIASVQSANVTAAYVSTKWEVVLLENSSFVSSPANGNVQDLVYARAFTVIPEPTTALLVLMGTTLLVSRRRRRLEV